MSLLTCFSLREKKHPKTLVLSFGYFQEPVSGNAVKTPTNFAAASWEHR